MPDVEHAGLRPPAVLPRLLLIFSLLAITGAARGEISFPEADALVAEGSIEKARAALLKAAEENAGTEREWEALFALNELEREGGRYIGRLLELADLWGKPEVFLALGRYRYAVGAYDSAEEDFRRAEDALGGTARREAQIWRGVAAAAAGREDEGLELLLDALKHPEGSDESKARFLAAQICRNREDYDGCVRILGPVLTGESDYLRPALLLYARVLEARGDPERARTRYAEVIDRFPGSGEAEEARRALAVMVRTVEAPAPGFWVQIASFESEENARRFTSDRRSAGTGAVEVHRALRDETPVYPVRVGPFETAEEAERAKGTLENQGLPGHVVEVREGN
ncbi:MAG: tetratricopeptide repeat protein [Candidatus Eisenbacteria bacterium]